MTTRTEETYVVLVTAKGQVLAYKRRTSPSVDQHPGGHIELEPCESTKRTPRERLLGYPGGCL